MSGLLERAIAIAGKEMRHLMREPRTLMVVFAQPVMLLVLYGYCLSFDLKEIPFAVWDQDHTAAARQFVRRVRTGGSPKTFVKVGDVTDAREVETLIGSGNVRFILTIPRGFERAVLGGRPITVQALFDGSDSNVAGVSAGYLSGAIMAHSTRVAARFRDRTRGGAAAATMTMGAEQGGPFDAVRINWRVFYNPDLSSRRFIVPGLMAVLLTTLAATLTSTCIVRERELGPLESLLTAPVGAVELVTGKLAPYVLVALGNITLVLLVGGLVFHTWPRGNVLTLYSMSLLFMLGMLSLGILISSGAPNQRVALLLAMFATMLPNIFLTGFAFPRSNMPWFLQMVSWPLPATQYLIAIRGVFLKGIGWSILWPQGLWMALTALFLIVRAVRIMHRSLARGLDQR